MLTRLIPFVIVGAAVAQEPASNRLLSRPLS